MSKEIAPYKYIKNEVTTLATCWKLKLKNNIELGFTDFTRDLDVDALKYKAQSGFYSSAVESNNSVSADNFEVGGFLDSEDIAKQDIMSGMYDNAYLEIFIVDYQNPNAKKIILKSGYLGKIEMLDNQFVAEVTGLSDKLSNSIGSLYSPTCRAKFCGDECKIEKPPMINCNIISVENKTQVRIGQEINNPLYNYGVMEVVDENACVISLAIRRCNKNMVHLLSPFNMKKFPQTCRIYAGCDKKFSTCSQIYNNALNFRGEPHVPGVDEIYKTAGTFR